MALPKFLKKKTTYIILALVLAGVGWYVYSRMQSAKTVYETVAVDRGDLMQTVEVTGEIKPAERIDLSFKNSGKISKIKVKIGDTVKAGDVLAELDSSDVQFAMKNAQAALSIAQANLASKLAGETNQSIRVAQTQVEQSQAAYEKALKDLDAAKKTTADAISSAQIALDTAQHNLNNSDALAAQNNQNAYDTSRTTLLNAVGPLQTALTDGDTIIGVNNTVSNQYYVKFLGATDSGSVDRAKASYSPAKASEQNAEVLTDALSASSTNEQIEAAASAIQLAITQVQSYLNDVQKVLAATITSSSFTATDLAAKNTTIVSDLSNVAAQKTAVVGAVQAVKDTGLTKTQTVQQLQDALHTAQVALNTAQTNANTQVQAANTAVTVQKAALDAAQANLDLKQAGPRSVDVEPLRAAVLQAQVAYDQSVNNLNNIQIAAPSDGIISDVLPSVGEQITANVAAIQMVGSKTFDIETKVPEADITKIQVGQTATITLDAYGDDVKFNGTVTSKDPAETLVQDAVYYLIHVQMDAQDKEVKPKMTANVTVNTAEVKDSLIIPLRTVRTLDNGQKTVRVLVNGQPQTRNITIGIKGDQGRVEVKSGLSQGEQVIASEKTGS